MMMLWAVVLTQTILLIALILLLFFMLRRSQRELQQLHQQVVTLSQVTTQQEQLSHEIKELRSGIIGVGQRVLQFESEQIEQQQQLQQVMEKQQSLELADPDAKIYSRAMKMVELGAGLEEIIRECELPRAEAELLLSLHQTKTR
jgi:biopolymer transport protein ExbB/TolQ